MKKVHLDSMDKQLAPTTQRNSLIEAQKKRDSFAEYFVGEGEVSWQNRMIE